MKNRSAQLKPRKPQLELLRKEKDAFGGDLFSTRKGRSGRRPLVTKGTMHLVLRSSKAKGDWSFKKPANDRAIRNILSKFTLKYSVKLLSVANVGNHIHLHFRLINRHTYRPFIRAISSAIAMAVTGTNRWTKIHNAADQFNEFGKVPRLKFWDQRPFTRVLQSRQAFLNLQDYIRINVLEGFGVLRSQAREIVRAGVFVNSG